jgi:hypothetical protein
MATSKRKRTATRTKQTNKRPKYNDFSDAELPASTQEDDKYWNAECILEERREKKRKGRRIVEYLVKWTDIDEKTGLVYPPEWSEKKDVTASLLASWEQDKAERVVAASREAARAKQSRNQLRVVESSPEPETLSSTGLPLQDSTPEHEPAVVEPESAPALPIQIQVRRRGSSFDRTDFERFSQTAESQATSAQSHTQDTDLDSSQLFAAVPEFRSSGVVPNSQSSTGEASFVATTQRTTGTTQPSSNVSTNASQEVTEDSVCWYDPISMTCLLTRACRGCWKLCKKPLQAHIRQRDPYLRLSTKPLQSPRARSNRVAHGRRLIYRTALRRS